MVNHSLLIGGDGVTEGVGGVKVIVGGEILKKGTFF